MATSSQTPTIAQLSQGVAHQLRTNYKQQLPEKLFAEAILTVRKELRSSQKVPKRRAAEEALLDHLATLGGIAGVERAVNQKVRESPVWGDNAKISPNGRFQKLLTYVTSVRPVVDGIVSAVEPTVAAPVWGAMCFILTIAQEVPNIEEDIKHVQALAKANAKAFDEYFMNPKRPAPEQDTSLCDALQEFYVILIRGAVATSPLFSSRWHVKGLFSREATGVVSSLKTDLKESKERVFLYGNPHKANELLDNIESLRISQGQSHATSASTGNRSLRIAHIANPHFAGRNAILQRIASSLTATSTHGAPRAVALCGMPGIGKTQTAINFAKSATLSSNNGYVHTMFVRAGEKSHMQLDLLMLAERVLVVQSGQVGEAATILRFQAWLETAEKWLLVVDNVADTNIVMNLVPASGNGDIIYTTRSPETAKLLCATDVVEVDRMSDAESREMLLPKAKNPFSASNATELDEAIKQITAFCHGLPLVMEQLVNTANYRKVSWMDELVRVKHKSVLLKQKAINGFHVDDSLDDHSAGAVLISCLDALKESDKTDMAPMLLFILAYLEPSSIPVAMLMEGSKQLDRWFDRPVSLDRGCARTAQGNQIVLEAHIRRRSPHMPSNSKKSMKKLLPTFLHADNRVRVLERADSDLDASVQQYWRAFDSLRAVFLTQANLETALNAIVATGLTKKITTDALGIHDVYAQLTTAYLEAEPQQPPQNPTTSTPTSAATKENHIPAQQALHLAATLVYLAFPPLTRHFLSHDACLSLLPHAQTTLRHLTEMNILADTTVGAELSHLAGCATDLMVLRTYIDDRQHGSLQVVGNADLDRARAEASLPFFRQAHSCYAAAARRVLVRELAGSMVRSPGRVRRRVAEAVRDDYALEEVAQARVGVKGWMAYGVDRHAWGYERFGSDPVRRRMDSLLKLGVMCGLAGKGEEAVRYLESAVEGYEWLLGKGHTLADKAREMLQVRYTKMGRWEEGLGVVGRRWRASLSAKEWRRMEKRRLKSAWRSSNEPRGAGLMARMAEDSPHLVDQAAQCLSGMGRHSEAVVLFEVLYRRGERAFGKESVENIPCARSLALTYGRAEDWTRCVFWWCVVFGLIFGAKDTDTDPSLAAGADHGEVDEAAFTALEDQGWWLGDPYDGSNDLSEEHWLWEYALSRWREVAAGSTEQQDRHAVEGLGALVGKTETDLACWRRRVAEGKRREKERERMEEAAVMREWEGKAVDRCEAGGGGGVIDRIGSMSSGRLAGPP